MTKLRALVGTVGQTSKITDITSLQAAEMEAMCRILEHYGYESMVAEAAPGPKSRAPKFPTGRAVWDGIGEIDLVWLHQQTPNYMGGVKPPVCVMMDLLAKGLLSAKKVVRLVVDNNETMQRKSFIGFGKRKECPAFPICEAELLRKESEGNWIEAGIPECADPNFDAPLVEVGFTSDKLLLCQGLMGVDEEKVVDLCYIGTNRSNKKKQAGRMAGLEEFATHPSGNFSGSMFQQRCGLIKGWRLMSEARAHLIARDPGMIQTPLHRYVQALVHNAVPIVLNEPAPVGFIHNEDLQGLLRVTTLEEGLDLVKRRDELMPLLIEERDYWIKFDRYRGPGLSIIDI